MRFEPGLLEHKQQSFGPLFGLFDDSLPDGWGLLLMDRHFRSLGRDPVSLTPLDRLLYLGRRTMGALTYHPPTHRSSTDNTLLDLHALASLSQQIFAGDEIDILPLLLHAGGSPGGARPKVLIGYNSQNRTIISGDDILPMDYAPWIIKFSAREDARDDHAKNFSFILDASTGQWSLAPAYDLTFSSGPGGEHSTTVAGEGRAPAYHHFVELAKQYDIPTKEVKSMIAEIADSKERWPEFAEAAGVSEAGTNDISKYF